MYEGNGWDWCDREPDPAPEPDWLAVVLIAVTSFVAGGLFAACVIGWPG